MSLNVNDLLWQYLSGLSTVEAHVPVGRYAIKGDVDYDSTQGFIDMLTDTKNRNRRIILPKNPAIAAITPYNISSTVECIQNLWLSGEHRTGVEIVNNGTGDAIRFSTASPTTPSSYLRGARVSDLTIRGTQAASTGAALRFRRCSHFSTSNLDLRESKFGLQLEGSVFSQHDTLLCRAGGADTYPLTGVLSGSAGIQIIGADLSGAEGVYPADFPGYLHQFNNVYSIFGAVGGVYAIESAIHIGGGDIACFFTNYYIANGKNQNILVSGNGSNDWITAATFVNGYSDSTNQNIGCYIKNNSSTDTLLNDIRFFGCAFGSSQQGIVADDPDLRNLEVKNCEFIGIRAEDIKTTGCTNLRLHAIGNSHTFSGKLGSKNIVDVDGAVEVVIRDTFDSYDVTNTAVRISGTHGLVTTEGSTYSGTWAAKANLTGATISNLQFIEGATWTPALKFGGAAVGMTFGTQTGTYSKRGDRIFYEGTFTLTAKGSSTGTAAIAGLPLTPAGISPATIGFYANLASISGTVVALVDVGSTIKLYNGNAATTPQLTEVNFSNIGTIYFGGNYRVAV